MNYQYIKTQLKRNNLEVFTTREFRVFFSFDSRTAAVKLTRYKNKGYIESPKRGVYYLLDEISNKFRVANRVYFPSYISMDSALSKYGLIPEVVYTITSVTSKATREFSDKYISYKYYRIMIKAYTGYIKENDYFIATPEKALVDYLYFVSNGKRQLNDRINFNRVDKPKVYEYAKLYSNQRLDNLLKKVLP